MAVAREVHEVDTLPGEEVSKVAPDGRGEHQQAGNVVAQVNEAGSDLLAEVGGWYRLGQWRSPSGVSTTTSASTCGRCWRFLPVASATRYAPETNGSARR